ncbi:MAG: pilus assembly protein PilM [Patescibacteria group bacterium]|nr:pilus assembly protein PilM [Patescibacteria group bacterium]
MINLNHYFPTPKLLLMPSFALDISDKSIKYGELKMGSKGLYLGRFGKKEIPEGVIISGKIEKESQLIKMLKELRKEQNLHFVRVALPEEQIYLFNISLPKEVGDIREAILLQLEEYVPLGAEEVLFDYEIVSVIKGNILTQVTAIPEVVVQKHLNVFEKAGLFPISFELEGQAVARAVIPKGNKEALMVVDFGETRTGISIVNNEKVSFTSTVDMGGDILTKMIAKNFSISYEEAEELKIEYCTKKNTEKENIFPIILNGLSVLRDELNKHFVYWHTHNNELGKKHKPIKKIILCGGNTNIPGLTEYIATSMKVEVENADVWINISKDRIPDMLYEESLGYSTILGLALGEHLYD